MNTITRILALGSAILLCSCIKEADKGNETVNTEVIIHATMAQDGDTKTVLQENGSVFWQPGDQIAVFFNSVKVPFTSYNSVDAASAYFVGNLDLTTAHNEGSDGTLTGEYAYLGLYPLYIPGMYSENNDFYWTHNRDLYHMYYEYQSDQSICSCSEGIVSTAMFPWQRGVEGTFDRFLNIAFAQSADYHELSFYNVLGGIRFTVQSPDITRITFRSNKGESLAGQFSVKMDANGKPSITDVSIPYDAVTVSLDDDKPFTPGEWYYLMMFPGVLSEGYTMEFYKADAMAKKVVSSSTEVKRSVFGSLQNPDQGLTYEPLIHAARLDIQNAEYSIQMVPGETVQLNASVYPTDCTFPLRWLSSNPEVATVDNDGLVTAIAEGYARISVSCDELEDEAAVYVGSTSSNTSFEIVSVDLSGADALALMPMPDDVIDYYRNSNSSEVPTCIYKIDEDGNVEPLKFTFSSSNSVLEQKLNESALVSGALYWMTDQYVFINNAHVYCLGAFSSSWEYYGNELQQCGHCFAIRRADNAIILIEDNTNTKSTFRFDERLAAHWYTQQLSRVFRWSYDNAYLYSWGYEGDHPYFRFVQSGNKLVAESLLDFSSSSFGLENRSVLLDEHNNLAYLDGHEAYVFFEDGGMADIPLPDGSGFRLIENNYNWYLFADDSNGTTVYQITVNGHSIELKKRASDANVHFNSHDAILRNDEVIEFINKGNRYKQTYNPQTNELVYTSFSETFPDSWDMTYNAFGVGYTLVDGALTEYDIVNLTTKTIVTDRSQVPQMTATTPYYDSTNNCFYETGTRYSDTKTITVVTNCDTGKVTVYEGAYESIFKSYLKL